MKGAASRRGSAESEPTSWPACAVKVDHLVVSYGSRVAVDDVSFTIRTGSVFGLVGPNGAGKTSIVESVLGLRQPAPTSRIEVFGLDPVDGSRTLRRVVGVQLQESAFPSRCRVGELCELYEAIYQCPRATGRLLRDYGLDDRTRSLISSLSGGLRQRLALVLAQIGDVRLVVLDELTTGLDPVQRASTWEAVKRLAKRGVTVLLTSHYMDEVEALCDEVGVLVEGHLVARGSPEELTEAYGGGATFFLLRSMLSSTLEAAIDGLHLATVATDNSAVVALRGDFPLDYERLVGVLRDEGLPSSIVRVHAATFEAAYLNLVGSKWGGV